MSGPDPIRESRRDGDVEGPAEESAAVHAEHEAGPTTDAEPLDARLAASAGAAAGAVTGVMTGGPVGAVVGAGTGAIRGLAVAKAAEVVDRKATQKGEEIGEDLLHLAGKNDDPARERADADDPATEPPQAR